MSRALLICCLFLVGCDSLTSEEVERLNKIAADARRAADDARQEADAIRERVRKIEAENEKLKEELRRLEGKD